MLYLEVKKNNLELKTKNIKMIKNFENITKELKQCELKHIDNLITVLSYVPKNNPIKTPELLKLVNYYAGKNNLMTMSGPRLRKLINYIRSNSLLPVIGMCRGYYVSYDAQDVSDEIKSLTQRSNSILDSVYGLNKILKKL